MYICVLHELREESSTIAVSSLEYDQKNCGPKWRNHWYVTAFSQQQNFVLDKQFFGAFCLSLSAVNRLNKQGKREMGAGREQGTLKFIVP